MWVSEWVSVCERERERERERKQRKPEAVFSLFLIGTSHSAFRLRPPFGPYNGAVRAGQRRVAVWSVAGMDFGRRRRRRPRRWLHSLLFIPLAIFDLRRNRIMRSSSRFEFDLDFANNAESSWQLGLPGAESYPMRPDEADCIYYLRTGFCGYGTRCRFNHPRDRAAVITSS